MSISQNFPEEGPTLNLNFAGSKVLDPRITFSRSSSSGDATYMDANGLIVTAAADEPRFDHRYVNGEVESLGLLVEEQRTNLILYSNDFSQSNWTKQNSHPTPSKNAIGPDGVANSASTVYRTATNQYLYQSISGGGTYTLSAWIKSEAATGSFTMQGYNATDGTMAESFTATNEWQRFETTISPTTNTGYYPCIPTNTNTNFYVWGVQVESGSFKTSYIPTSGSTKTRSPDSVSMTGTNFSDWYNQSEGTVYAQFRCDSWNDANSGSNYNRVYVVSSNDGFENDSFWIANDPFTDNSLRYRIRFSGVNQFGPANVVRSSNNIKSSFAVKTNDIGLTLDGVLSASSDSALLPSIMQSIHIGSEPASGGIHYLNGTISQLTYYPVRLSNTVLQNLTK